MKQWALWALCIFIAAAAMGCAAPANAEASPPPLEEAPPSPVEEAPYQEEKPPQDTANEEAPVPLGDFVDVITSAYSAKSFTEEGVDAALIQQILEAGVQAPSARNIQPWKFTVLRNAGLVSDIVGGSATQGTVAIIISGMDEEAEGVDVSFDCGLATQNMYIAAQSMGLAAHLYSGPVRNINSLKDTYGIPGGYSAVCVMLVGYTDEDAVSAASARNPLTDTVNYMD